MNKRNKDNKNISPTPIENLIAEVFGEVGTPERDAFEME